MEDDTSSAPADSWLDRWFRYLDRRRASDRALLLLVLAVLAGAISYVLFTFDNQSSVTNATQGGRYTEGVVGTPRFVNPVLAITQADHDLVALVYSGLLTLNQNGRLTEDLAESVTVSEDGTIYNIVLKDGLTFHDGAPLTAADVVYTIGLIQSPELKSPLRGNWNGVSVAALGEREINIVLEDAYAPFIENLTTGILPKHIWSTLSIEELPFSQHNTEPLGSGPYQIAEVQRNASGLINAYTLTPFKGNNKHPNLATFELHFYQNDIELEEAFRSKEILGSAALPLPAVTAVDTKNYQIISETLPRVFSVFINQNKTAALRDPAVREALSVAINREELIDEVLLGFGEPTTAPVPEGFFALESTPTTTITDRLATARNILLAADWKITESGEWVKEIEEVETVLSIAIATANSEVFAATASYLEDTWSELGVEVSVALFEQADLVQAIIRPRDYQALLFGTDVSRSLDLYPFWHSSQRDDPGLNVALYTSITADDLLEDIRITNDETTRNQLLRDVIDEIESETPAIFLFNPSLVYVIHNSVNAPPFKRISKPSERFSTIADWHIAEESIWPLFTTSETATN